MASPMLSQMMHCRPSESNCDSHTVELKCFENTDAGNDRVKDNNQLLEYPIHDSWDFFEILNILQFSPSSRLRNNINVN